MVMPTKDVGIVISDDLLAKISDRQVERLNELARRWRGVEVFPGTFDLPPGYISIKLDPHGHPIYGGISPEGDVST